MAESNPRLAKRFFEKHYPAIIGGQPSVGYDQWLKNMQNQQTAKSVYEQSKAYYNKVYGGVPSFNDWYSHFNPSFKPSAVEVAQTPTGGQPVQPTPSVAPESINIPQGPAIEEDDGIRDIPPGWGQQPNVQVEGKPSMFKLGTPEELNQFVEQQRMKYVNSFAGESPTPTPTQEPIPLPPGWEQQEEPLLTRGEMESAKSPNMLWDERNQEYRNFQSEGEPKFEYTPKLIKNSWDFILNEGLKGSAIGMMHKASTGYDMTSFDEENSDYVPDIMDKTAAASLSLLADMAFFLPGGMLGSLAARSIGKGIASQIIKQSAKRGITDITLTKIGRAFLNPKVARWVEAAATGSGSLAVYNGIKDVLSQVAVEGKDAKDISWGQTLDATAQGGALGAAVSLMGFGTTLASKLIETKITGALGKAATYGAKAVGFGGENAIFVYGGAMLEGRDLKNNPITGEDWAMSVGTLGILKGVHGVTRWIKSKNHTPEKANEGEFRLSFDKDEVEFLNKQVNKYYPEIKEVPIEKPVTTEITVEPEEPVITTLKGNKNLLRKILNEPTIPFLTKAKLLWGIKGVAPAGGIPDIVRVTNNKNRVEAFDDKGNLILSKKYDTNEEAENETINLASFVSEAQKRKRSAQLDPIERAEIINNLKASGVDFEILNSGIEKMLEPWERTPEEVKAVKNFDDAIAKHIEEKQSGIDKKVSESQKRLEVDPAVKTTFSDEIQTTISDLSGKEPIVNERLQEASDEVYKRMMVLYKTRDNENRRHTRQQIDDEVQRLSDIVDKLEKRLQKQTETGEFEKEPFQFEEPEVTISKPIQFEEPTITKTEPVTETSTNTFTKTGESKGESVKGEEPIEVKSEESVKAVDFGDIYQALKEIKPEEPIPPEEVQVGSEQVEKELWMMTPSEWGKSEDHPYGYKHVYNAVKEAIEQEKYQKAIVEGKMTLDDAKRVIESVGLEVPKDILSALMIEEPMMKTEQMTTAKLSEKARNGYTVFINGAKKSCFQLNNMKGKTYTVIIEDKIIKTINYQTLLEKTKTVIKEGVPVTEEKPKEITYPHKWVKKFVETYLAQEDDVDGRRKLYDYIYNLSGDAMKDSRQELMSALKGVKVPKAKSGVSEILKAVNEFIDNNGLRKGEESVSVKENKPIPFAPESTLKAKEELPENPELETFLKTKKPIPKNMPITSHAAENLKRDTKGFSEEDIEKVNQRAKELAVENDRQIVDFGDIYQALKEIKEERQSPENVKKFLEGNLPSTTPGKYNLLDVSEVGDVTIKPIEKKTKIKATNEALKGIVSDDEMRLAMLGIFYDAENQTIVSTDANVLVVIPTKVEGPSRIINPKNGGVIEDRYPHYSSVIPFETTYTDVNLQGLFNEVSGVERAGKFTEGVGILLKANINGNDIYFQASNVRRVLQALMETGTSNVIVQASEHDRAMVFRDADNFKKLGLVMPIIFEDTMRAIHTSQYLKGEKKPLPKDRMIEALIGKKEGVQREIVRLNKELEKEKNNKSEAIYFKDRIKDSEAEVERLNGWIEKVKKGEQPENLYETSPGTDKPKEPRKKSVTLDPSISTDPADPQTLKHVITIDKIMRNAIDNLNITWGRGVKKLLKGATPKKVRGYYNIKSKIIHIKDLRSIGTFFHELGHKLYFTVFDLETSFGVIADRDAIVEAYKNKDTKAMEVFREQYKVPEFDALLETIQMHDELLDWINTTEYPVKNIREAAAEYLKHYVLDRDGIEGIAPKFRELIERTEKSDPKLREAFDTVNTLYHIWDKGQTIMQKSMSLFYNPVDLDMTRREKLKQKYDNIPKVIEKAHSSLMNFLYNDKYANKFYTELALKHGIKLSTEENPEYLFAVYRGLRSVVDSWLTLQPAFITDVDGKAYKKVYNTKSYRDIVGDLKARGLWEAQELYEVAMRNKELFRRTDEARAEWDRLNGLKETLGSEIETAEGRLEKLRSETDKDVRKTTVSERNDLKKYIGEKKKEYKNVVKEITSKKLIFEREFSMEKKAAVVKPFDRDEYVPADRKTNDALLNELYTKVPKADLELRSTELRNYRDALLKFAVDSGLITRADYMNIKDYNQFYVPFHRFTESFEVFKDIDGKWKIKGNVFTERNSLEDEAIKAFQESKKTETGLLNHIELSDIENTKNILAKALLNKWRLSQVDLLIKLQEKSGEIGVEAESLIEQLKNKDIAKWNEFTITVKRNGNPEYYQVSEDIYNKMFKPDKPTDLGGLGFFRHPVSWLYHGAIIYNVNFATKNAMRDVTNRPFYTQSVETPEESAALFLKGLTDSFKKDEVFQDFMASGAHVSFSNELYSTLQELQNKGITDFFDPKTERTILKKVLDGITEFNNKAEYAGRLGTFDKVLKESGSYLKAVHEARMSGADYKLRGKYAKIPWTRGIPFLNPNLQHQNMSLSAFKRMPLKTLSRGFDLAAYATTIWFWNNYIAPSLYPDKKIAERVNSYDRYWKRFFLLTYIPGADIFFPFPLNPIGVLFTSPLRSALDHYVSKNPTALQGMANDVARSFGLSPSAGQLAQYTLPAGVPVIMGALQNYNYAFDSQIESGADKEKPKTMRKSLNTPELYVATSEAIQSIFGEEHTISPKKIEFMFKGFTGAVGDQLIRTSAWMLGTFGVTKPVDPWLTKDITKIPIVSVFAKNNYDVMYTNQYRDLQQIIEKENIRKTGVELRQKKDFKSAFEYEKEVEHFNKGAWWRSNQTDITHFVRNVMVFNETMREYYKSLDKGKRDKFLEQYKEINAGYIQVMDNLVKDYYKLEKEKVMGAYVKYPYKIPDSFNAMYRKLKEYEQNALELIPSKHFTGK